MQNHGLKKAMIGAVAGLLLSGGPAVAADDLNVFPGEKLLRIGLEVEDLVVHKMDDEFYTESWYLMSPLDDGRELYIHFGLTNAGFGSFTGVIETTVIDKDGTVHFEKSQIDSDDIKFTTDNLTLDFDGDHTLEGNAKQLRMRSDGDDLGFELVFDSVVPGVVFGDGKTYFDEDKEEFYALRVLPKGKVTGALVVDGAKTPVSGWAYADHSWQNYPAHKMADRLYSIRGFTDQDSAAFLAFKVPDGGLLATLILTEGDSVGMATHKLRMAEAGMRPDPEKDDYLLPSTIAVKGVEGGPAVEGLIHLGDRSMRQDAVKDFSFFERTLIKMFVAKPILYRYRTQYAFEYATPETTRSVQGQGPLEAVILNSD